MYEEFAPRRRMRAVTISREYGSGGGEIAARLAKRLGWQLVDHALVERVASEFGTSTQEAEVHDEHVHGMVSQALNNLLYLYPVAMASTPPEAFLSDEAYCDAFNRVVRAAAARGHVVIVGRASQVILADLRDVLHVRVIAPFEKRVVYVMQREGIDHHTAESRIHRKDHERASYLEREYHHYPDDAQLYDLVLNTSLLDLERAVDIICFTLHEFAKGLAKKTSELGPATGLSPYPAPPEDFRPPAR
jgi:CMP/dCMP kinase